MIEIIYGIMYLLFGFIVATIYYKYDLCNILFNDEFDTVVFATFLVGWPIILILHTMSYLIQKYIKFIRKR